MRHGPPVSPTARVVAVALVAGGALLMVVAVFADQLELSSVGGQRGDGFGWTQLIAAIVGLVLLLVGVAWLLRPALGGDADEPLE